MSRTWKEQKEWKEFRSNVKRQMLRPKRYWCKSCNMYWRSMSKSDCPVCDSVHFGPVDVK
jgi:rubrerythrin